MKSAMVRLGVFMAVGWLVAGCTLRAPVGRAGLQVENAPSLAVTLSPPTVTPSPSPVVRVAPTEAQPTVMSSPLSPQSDPLRFTFPTSPAEAISLWRPPLYPVPWEPTPYDHFYFTRPIGADEVNWPLARYRYGYLLYNEPHTGIDVPAPKGTPILAAGSGTVMWAGYGLYFQKNIENDPYGIAVLIKHDFGYKGETLYTVYGHMNEAYVYRGQQVQAGEQIGVVGETGKVSGPHLHFEVRVGNDSFFTTRNPELWISPPQGMGVLAARLMRDADSKATKVNVMLRSKEGKGNFDVVSYADGAVNSDPYYNENLVLGDIPAGVYRMFVTLNGTVIQTEATIVAGQVNFFTYTQRDGLVFQPPPTPSNGFIPPDATTAVDAP
jgi:murein DD-endopeptidase MepM/ murein hydrolase activator NlpD